MSVTYRTNLVPNPDFRATSGTVEVRRNMCTNPSLETAATDWAGWAGAGSPAGAFTRETSGGVDGGAFGRYTWTTPPTSGGGITKMEQSMSGAVAANTTYTFSMWVRCSVAVTVTMQGQWYKSGTPTTAVTQGTPTAVPANTWTRVSTTATSGAADNQVQVRGYITTGTLAAGSTFDGDQCLIEKTGALLPYFDGTTPNGFDLNLVSSWTGTVGSSASTAVGPRVADWTQGTVPGGTCPYWQAEDGASLYVRNQTNAALVSSFSLIYNAAGLPIPLGATVSASARNVGATPFRFRVQGYVGGSSTGATTSLYAPDVGAGSTGTIDGFVNRSDVGNVRMIITPSVAGLAVGALMRVDQTIVEAASAAGFYFDGSTPNTDGWRTAWAGAADASTSVMSSPVGLTVNGVDVQTYAWNVKNRSGRWKVPGRRGKNRELPGLHGTSRLTGKPFEENTVVLTMWVIGANHDGSLPVSPSRRRMVEQYVDQLGRLFSAPVVTLVQGRTDGDRQLVGEVTSAIDFTSMAGATRAEFGVEIVAADPFWYAVGAPAAQTVVTASAGTYAFSTFADVTAPVIKAAFTVTGPVNSPVLTDPVTEQWVKYAGNVPAGQSWVVDSAAWTSTVNGVNVLANTSHGGGATFLDLTPDAAGPRVQLGGTGQTSATSVRLTARKAYLSA